MSELVAIAHPQLYIPTKRDALLFERFGMLGFRNRPQQEDYHIRAELEWLAERGLVFETSMLVVDGDFPSDALPYAEEAFAHTTIAATLDIVAVDPAKYELLNSQGKLRKRLEKLPAVHRNVDLAAVARKAHYRLEDILQSSGDLTAAATAATEDALQASARFVSQLHRVVNGFDAIPIGPVASLHEPRHTSRVPAAVIRVVLEALPSPTDDTPWEQVIDFRADDAARVSLRRLRRWMSSLGTQSQSEAELRDELQGLLDEYSEYMRVHKMKVTRGVIETIVTTAGEVAEDIVKLRFGKLTNMLFTVSAHRVTLLEAELAAPGREIAYISKAHETFTRTGA